MNQYRLFIIYSRFFFYMCFCFCFCSFFYAGVSYGKSQAAVKSQQGTQKSDGLKNNTKWAALKAELLEFTRKLNKKTTPREKRLDLFPRINRALSIMQDLKLKGSEQEDQIHITVQLILSAADIDDTNSMIDTVFYDYRAHRTLYLKALEKYQNHPFAAEVKTSFANFEKAEKINQENEIK